MAKKDTNITPKQTKLEKFFNVGINLKYIPAPEMPINVGDKYRLTHNTQTITVLETLYDGRVIKYSVDSSDTDDYEYCVYYDLANTKFESEVLFNRNYYNSNGYNSCLSSLYSKVLYFGVNADPEYQRGLVWSLENKKSYIRHLFNENNSSGVFVFAHNDYANDGYLYEIIDGKQRLNTIIDFYLNRFSVDLKGKNVYYRDLSPLDVRLYENRIIQCIEFKNLTESDKMKIFLNVNADGVVQDKDHLEYVKQRYTKLQELEVKLNV